MQAQQLPFLSEFHRWTTPHWIMWILPSILLASNGCSGEIHENHPHLQIHGGHTYIGEKLFTGSTVKRSYRGILVRKTHYFQGLKEGDQQAYHPNGVLSSKRSYQKGKKVGEHLGYYADGKRRFQGFFQNGKPQGIYRQWHRNGALYQETHYDDSGQVVSYKTWRSNGQIYANAVLKDGRLYGLPGDDLCVSLGP